MDLVGLPARIDRQAFATLVGLCQSLSYQSRNAFLQILDMQNRGKRILLLLPEAFGSAGGIQMFCRSLCLAAGRWAQRNDALVSAIVLNDGGDKNFAPDPRYINGGFHSYIACDKSKAKFVYRYLKQLLAYKPDIILFGHIALSPLALLTLAPDKRVKSCVITYGIEAWQTLSSAERKALQRAEAVLAISDYTRDEVIKRNHLSPAKVKLFPCALDPFWAADAQSQSQESAPPLLLTVSRLTTSDAYKGVDSVIESLPMVIREFGAIDYRIVGSGDDLPRLRRLAEKLGVADSVTFTGTLTNEALQECYRRCSLFVMPSEGEGFGIVFLEAMAYAKAVIGGAHAGTPSVVVHGETGLLVERSDTSGLGQAIIQILRDHELRRKFGRAGKQRLLDKFVFDRFEENLGSLLTTCLADRESARPPAKAASEIKID
jgi:phosphatidyl-myo-inositol dimannoside synthase